MTALKVVEGSLLDSRARYIAHQTNCVSSRAAHMAASMFSRFPHADVYSRRAETGIKDTPGTIVVCGDGLETRPVINMMAQYFPGKPKFPDSELDGFAARKRYFFTCLKQVAEIPELTSIAFPYGIGCGAAGGSWEQYLSILEKFAVFVGDRAEVTLVKLPTNS